MEVVVQTTLRYKYRIAGVFRGYKFSWFLRIRHVPWIFIIANLISHAHAVKRCYSTKIYFTKIYSAKTFLKAFPWKCIPSKYTRYTVCPTMSLSNHILSECIGVVVNLKMISAYTQVMLWFVPPVHIWAHCRGKNINWARLANSLHNYKC